MISRELLLRSEPHFHDVDGACQWISVKQKAVERLLIVDPKFTAEQWSEQMKFGWNRVRVETYWYKSDNTTPAFIPVNEGHCTALDQL